MPGAFSIPMRLDPSRAADGATAPGRARALRLCGWRPRPPRDTAASRDAPIDAASPEGVDEDEAAPSLHHRLREQTGSLLQMVQRMDRASAAADQQRQCEAVVREMVASAVGRAVTAAMKAPPSGAAGQLSQVAPHEVPSTAPSTVQEEAGGQ